VGLVYACTQEDEEVPLLVLAQSAGQPPANLQA
jgi:hypothetical protein